MRRAPPVGRVAGTLARFLSLISSAGDTTSVVIHAELAVAPEPTVVRAPA
jgi:hypothetical protein